MTIETVAQLIRTHGTERAAADAIRFQGATLSYGELYRRARQVASGLAAAGVDAQDHVCFLDKNGPECFEAWFGCALLNAVMTPVNWRLAPREVAFIVNDAQAKVLVVGADFASVLAAVEGELTTVKKILVIDGDGRYEDWAAWRDAQPDTDPGADGADGDIAVQMYSSGTTGLPKGVMLSNANLFALLPSAEQIWEFSAASVNLVAMPLFHIGGGGWALVGLFYGGPMVLLRDVDPTKVVELLSTQGVTHAFLVPAVLQFCLLVPGVADADFSALRVIVYGASPISTQVLTDSIATFGCKFVQAYGLTETTGAIVSLPPEDHDPSGPNAHRLRAAGKANVGVELRVVDVESGEDMPLGEVGEIWSRSRQNMKGYWGNPDATAKTVLDGGWLRTGDAGYLDADGYLYIHDRVKDMIVSGGENIYPAEIENVLMSHPAVADVAVIGVPHERWGETPKAMIVRAAGADVTVDDVIAYCRDRLAKYKCPTSVEFIDALPRNPSGKILKKDLRAPYWAGKERMVN